MTKVLIGVVLGIVVATVGFTGIARMLDTTVNKIQEQTRELSK